MRIANALGNLAETAIIAEQVERAADLTHEGMVLLHRSGDRRGTFACILLTARALIGLGRYEGGALLCGAVSGGLEAIAASPNSPEWDGLKLATDTVRQRLGAARFAAAHARGRAMNTDQILALSLNRGAIGSMVGR